MADENAADCMKHNLLELAPKIISVAEKRNLAAKESQELLQLCHQPNDADVDEAEMTEGMCTCSRIYVEAEFTLSVTKIP